MQSLCLTLARFCLSAWVGAAGLFVVTSIHEQRSPRLDSSTKDVLALLRFPDYYLFGFALVATGLGCALAARNHPALGRRRAWLAVALIAAALLVMLGDYLFVYRPLAASISPPGAPRTPRFETLHAVSEFINHAHVSLCLAAAILLSWTRKTPAGEP